MSTATTSTGRTLLRGFLLVGGLALLGLGIAEGSRFNIGIGILATLLGGFGLWWEWNRQLTDDRQDD